MRTAPDQHMGALPRPSDGPRGWCMSPGDSHGPGSPRNSVVVLQRPPVCVGSSVRARARGPARRAAASARPANRVDSGRVAAYGVSSAARANSQHLGALDESPCLISQPAATRPVGDPASSEAMVGTRLQFGEFVAPHPSHGTAPGHWTARDKRQAPGGLLNVAAARPESPSLPNAAKREARVGQFARAIGRSLR